MISMIPARQMGAWDFLFWAPDASRSSLKDSGESSRTGESMPKIEVWVQLTETAVKDFKAIQNSDNFLVSEWGAKCLKELLEFTPRRWLEVRRRWARGIFKIDDLILFDIRGKVEPGADPRILQVFVTHFKLKAGLRIVPGKGSLA
jgi:hypothetical protein